MAGRNLCRIGSLFRIWPFMPMSSLIKWGEVAIAGLLPSYFPRYRTIVMVISAIRYCFHDFYSFCFLITNRWQQFFVLTGLEIRMPFGVGYRFLLCLFTLVVVVKWISLHNYKPLPTLWMIYNKTTRVIKTYNRKYCTL